MSEAEIINYKIAGLIIFMSIFLAAAFYAYRPKNRSKMNDYSKIPLED
jgi:cbb3-type cytochrome oxidase subunit 3